MFLGAARELIARWLDPETVQPNGLRDRIRLEARNAEALLTAWLETLARLYDREREIITEFRVRALTETLLDIDVGGELLDPARHVPRAPGAPVRAGGVALRALPDGWEARIAFL